MFFHIIVLLWGGHIKRNTLRCPGSIGAHARHGGSGTRVCAHSAGGNVADATGDFGPSTDTMGWEAMHDGFSIG